MKPRGRDRFCRNYLYLVRCRTSDESFTKFARLATPLLSVNCLYQMNAGKRKRVFTELRRGWERKVPRLRSG